MFALYYLELAASLRRGELLGLKWEAIDLEHGDLRVRRQVARIDGRVVEVPLKTKNAYSTLPLAEDMVSILKEQKKKVGSSPWVRWFHDLRHTFATLALQNGVDIKTASGMLGRFSAGFTLDTYAHVTTSAQKAAANTMGKLLSRSV